MSIARMMQQAAAGNSAGPEGAWDLSYAYYDPPAGLAGDLSTAVYANKSLDASAQLSNAYSGIFFKPDGTKLYITEAVSGSGRLNEYSLSTPWDVSTGSYVGDVSISTASFPTGLYFKPDGTKAYVVGLVSDAVFEYSLSPAWDISTLSYVQSFSVAAQEANPYGVFFKPDGTKMYVIGTTGDDVNEYDLSIAWDISTASYLQNFSVASQENSPTDVFFAPDGFKMYVAGFAGSDVLEYTLSTAWDVSSASYTQNFSVSAQASSPSALFFSQTLGTMYVFSTNTETVYQYTLGGFSVAAQETGPQGLFFKPDGAKMYILGASGDDVNEYNLSTPWDTSTASYLQSFSVAGQETTPYGLFFKPDGTKMYVTGAGGDDVNEYSLSTAWDISTASYVQNFSVLTQTNSPDAVFFKPDGTKMYITGYNNSTVNEYSLSVAWDISSASFTQSVAVLSGPDGLFFKPDGTKMYFARYNADTVEEYGLSTPWDISSVLSSQTFSVSSQTIRPTSVAFKDDGMQMFIVSPNTDRIFSYTLGVQE